jgi:penicillin-binding protein 2
VAWDDLKRIRPDFETPEPRRAELSDRHRRTISQGLWRAVNDGGTAGRAALKDIEICGKTGTAQRVSRAYAKEKNDPKLLDDAWFVGYAPCREPEIVVAALFENGEHGHFSAPIVRDVIKAYYDKQRRIEWSLRGRPAADAEASAAALRLPGGVR